MARYCLECDARLPDEDNPDLQRWSPRHGRLVPAVACTECGATYPGTSVPHLGVS